MVFVFFPSWLNMKVVRVVGIMEKLYLSECHRLHGHTVSSAALQNKCLFFPFKQSLGTRDALYL